MRRSVVIAAGMAGVACAARMKELRPQDEVNLLLPPGVLSVPKGNRPLQDEAAGAVRRSDQASLMALSGHDVAVMEAGDLLLDVPGNEITVITENGRLGIRYTDLVVEATARARIPRKLSRATNVLSAPFSGFAAKTAECDALFARAVTDKRPVLVAGGGMPALECIFLAVEAGANVIWAAPDVTANPSLDDHILSYLSRLLGPAVLRIALPQGSLASASCEVAPDESLLLSVTDADGRVIPLAGALWADTLMAAHPILREEGFVLDQTGRIAREAGAPGNIYLIGDGASAPSATLSDGIALPGYAGLASAAMATALFAAEKISGGSPCSPGLLGSCAARSSSYFLFRSGMTLADAAANGVEADHATLPFSLNELENPSSNALLTNCDSDGKPVLVLTLVAHKATGALLGAQVLGLEGARSTADALSVALVRALSDKNDVNALAGQEACGPCGILVAKAAELLRKKLSGTFYGISPAELIASKEAGADFFFLDVRSESAWSEKHLHDSYNIPLYQLKKRASSEIPRLVPIAIVSATGGEAVNAATILTGFGATDLYLLDGGTALWPFGMEQGKA